MLGHRRQSRIDAWSKEGDDIPDDEDPSDDILTVVVGDRLSLPSASESGQCGGRTEDDPVDPVTRKATAIDFSRAISSNPTNFGRRVGRPDAGTLYAARAHPSRAPAADREDQVARRLQQPQVQGGGCARPIPVERSGGRPGG
jgi:hypothetical protein